MADLKFDIDVEAIVENFGNMKDQLTKEITESVGNLASMTHAKTLELARDKLSSLSQMYMDNVEFSNPMENFWVVTLKEPAMWIEEGRKSGFMEELLNGKSGKVNQKGERYAVIPFQHNKNPSQQSGKARELADQIKKAMRNKGLNWKKIERNEDGSPRVGMLHRFNVESARLKPEHKSSPTQGVAVYQTKDKAGNVRRDVLTFRVIHQKHRNEGLWNHPGRAGEQLMDQALQWAMDEWERNILPAVLNKYTDNE